MNFSHYLVFSFLLSLFVLPICARVLLGLVGSPEKDFFARIHRLLPIYIPQLFRLLLSGQTLVKGEMLHQGLQHLRSQSIAVLVPSLPFIVWYVAGDLKSIGVATFIKGLAWFDVWWWRRLGQTRKLRSGLRGNEHIFMTSRNI